MCGQIPGFYIFFHYLFIYLPVLHSFDNNSLMLSLVSGTANHLNWFFSKNFLGILQSLMNFTVSLLMFTKMSCVNQLRWCCISKLIRGNLTNNAEVLCMRSFNFLWKKIIFKINLTQNESIDQNKRIKIISILKIEKKIVTLALAKIS